ncbi:MAG: hypothetical protein CL947_00610 [Epsilonproteobacteria bacterium]|nr:hypothetical protein [Campylobacterota bacterium]
MAESYVQNHSQYLNVTFDQVALNDDVIPVKLPYVDSNNLGMAVGFKSGICVFANPYNKVSGWYQVPEVAQPMAHVLASCFGSGLYVVPFLTLYTAGTIVKDWTKLGVNSVDQAIIWIALFDGNKNLIASTPVSGDCSPGEQIFCRILQNGNYGSELSICPDASKNSNADVLVRSNGSNVYAVSADFNTICKMAGLSNSFSDSFTQDVGDKVVQALFRIWQGTVVGGGSVRKPYFDTTKSDNWFIDKKLLTSVATMLQGSGSPIPAVGKTQNTSQSDAGDTTVQRVSFNSFGTDEVAKNYIQQHLVPALTAFGTDLDGLTITDKQKTSINPNFDVQTWNSVVINKINNKTATTFDIYQGAVKIGILQPGFNTVALYGAAQAGGDIVFMPQEQPDLGSFRVSFQKGQDLIKDIASPQDVKGSLPGANDEFVCVQIKHGTRDALDSSGAGDYPSSFSDQYNIFSRNQCLNTAQLSGPTYVDLQIEDSISITVGDTTFVTQQPQNAQKGKTTVPLFYPSIQNVVSLANQQNSSFNQQVPSLLLPDVITNNRDKEIGSEYPYAQLTSWIDFINAAIGILNFNYTKFVTPVAVNSLFSATNARVLVNKNSTFGSFDDYKNGYVYAGLVNTKYYPSDIPSDQSLVESIIPSRQVLNFSNIAKGNWSLSLTTGGKTYNLLGGSTSGIKLKQVEQALTNASLQDLQLGMYFVVKLDENNVTLSVYDHLGNKMLSEQLVGITSLDNVTWQGSVLSKSVTTNALGITASNDVNILPSTVCIVNKPIPQPAVPAKTSSVVAKTFSIGGPEDNQNLAIAFTVNYRSFYVANNTKFSLDFFNNLSEIMTVLNDISKVTLDDWKKGIYFSLLEHDNKVYVYVQNSNGDKIVQTQIPPKEFYGNSITTNVDWIFGNRETPDGKTIKNEEQSILLPASKTLGLTINPSTSGMLKTVNLPDLSVVTKPLTKEQSSAVKDLKKQVATKDAPKKKQAVVSKKSSKKQPAKKQSATNKNTTSKKVTVSTNKQKTKDAKSNKAVMPISTSKTADTKSNVALESQLTISQEKIAALEAQIAQLKGTSKSK